ncbi:hypothetical protein Aperf_G00000095911 [Anoplocephala perfoliata]
MTALVGPLFLLLCVPVFVQAARLPGGDVEFEDLDPNANLQTIIKALDEMPAEEIQRKIDTFPELEKYIKRFNRESLSAVVTRVPNLDYNLLRLQLSTLSFIYRKVDGQARQYMLTAAPRAMLKLRESMKDGKEEVGKKKKPDDQRLNEEKPPHKFDEKKSEKQSQPQEQEGPFLRYHREQTPKWFERRQSPLGYDIPIVIRYPYAEYLNKLESQSQHEMKPKPNQDWYQQQKEPIPRYPRQGFPFWPEARRPPPRFNLPLPFPIPHVHA